MRDRRTGKPGFQNPGHGRPFAQFSPPCLHLPRSPQTTASRHVCRALDRDELDHVENRPTSRDAKRDVKRMPFPGNTDFAAVLGILGDGVGGAPERAVRLTVVEANMIIFVLDSALLFTPAARKQRKCSVQLLPVLPSRSIAQPSMQWTQQTKPRTTMTPRPSPASSQQRVAKAAEAARHLPSTTTLRPAAAAAVKKEKGRVRFNSRAQDNPPPRSKSPVTPPAQSAELGDPFVPVPKPKPILRGQSSPSSSFPSCHSFLTTFICRTH